MLESAHFGLRRYYSTGRETALKFENLQNVFEFFGKIPKTSERFRTLPTVSERVRMHPSRYEQVPAHLQTHENFEKLTKTSRKLRDNFAKIAFVPSLFWIHLAALALKFAEGGVCELGS